MSSCWPRGTRLLRTPLGLSYARGSVGDASAAASARLILAHGLGDSKEVLAIAPAFPRGSVAVRVLGGAEATHDVAMEQPALLASAIVDDLSSRALLPPG